MKKISKNSNPDFFLFKVKIGALSLVAFVVIIVFSFLTIIALIVVIVWYLRRREIGSKRQKMTADE